VTSLNIILAGKYIAAGQDLRIFSVIFVTLRLCERHTQGTVSLFWRHLTPAIREQAVGRTDHINNAWEYFIGSDGPR
jgi:hypothetical protein